MSPTQEEMTLLTQARDRASARVEVLKRDARSAQEAATEASLALAEFERRGGRPAERRKLEQALADAKAKAAEPWAERIAGAQQRVRDQQHEMQLFVGANLSELVATLEEEGRVVAATINAACEQLLKSFAERERIAGEISQLVSLIARVQPGDVSYSKSEQLAKLAADLLAGGGEPPPTLRRDPRQPRHGPPAETAAA
jgi:chromosome segregation ATPase